MKKTIALLLALVMVFALAGTSAFAAPVEVTIFNSKMRSRIDFWNCRMSGTTATTTSTST